MRTVEIALGDELASGELRLAIEVALGVHDRHLGLGRLGAGFRVRRTRVLDVCARALNLRLLGDHRCLCRLHIGARLVHLRLENLRIDLRDHLVLPDHGIEVDE